VPWVVERLAWHPLRLKLCTLWVILIACGVAGAMQLRARKQADHNTVRKVYHLVAVLIFIPATILEPW